MQFTGLTHVGSELCGVVFNPSQTRLYVTSQREISLGGPLGAIYEISGPFRIPDSGIPADLVYGPPIGEPATVALVFDSRAIKRPGVRRPPNIVLARGKREHPETASSSCSKLKLGAGRASS